MAIPVDSRVGKGFHLSLDRQDRQQFRGRGAQIQCLPPFQRRGNDLQRQGRRDRLQVASSHIVEPVGVAMQGTRVASA
jgi:hypothetical protein